MSDRPAGGMARALSAVLGYGTIVSVGAVLAGVVLDLAAGGGGRPGTREGWLEVLSGGGPISIVAAGLLALGLVPVAAVAVAAVAFMRAGERRYLVISAAVLVLLLAGLAAAVVAARPTGG